MPLPPARRSLPLSLSFPAWLPANFISRDAVWRPASFGGPDKGDNLVCCEGFGVWVDGVVNCLQT